jgi:putative membrane protein
MIARMPDPLDPDDQELVDASRRTYLAAERTLLAWWRSAIAAIAVAIGVGRVVPALTHADRVPYVALGIAFALLGLAYVVYGTVRYRALRLALETGRYRETDTRVVLGFTIAMVLLAVVTVILLLISA